MSKQKGRVLGSTKISVYSLFTSSNGQKFDEEQPLLGLSDEAIEEDDIEMSSTKLSAHSVQRWSSSEDESVVHVSDGREGQEFEEMSAESGGSGTVISDEDISVDEVDEWKVHRDDSGTEVWSRDGVSDIWHTSPDKGKDEVSPSDVEEHPGMLNTETIEEAAERWCRRSIFLERSTANKTIQTDVLLTKYRDIFEEKYQRGNVADEEIRDMAFSRDGFAESMEGLRDKKQENLEVGDVIEIESYALDDDDIDDDLYTEAKAERIKKYLRRRRNKKIYPVVSYVGPVRIDDYVDWTGWVLEFGLLVSENFAPFMVAVLFAFLCIYVYENPIRVALFIIAVLIVSLMVFFATKHLVRFWQWWIGPTLLRANQWMTHLEVSRNEFDDIDLTQCGCCSAHEDVVCGNEDGAIIFCAKAPLSFVTYYRSKDEDEYVFGSALVNNGNLCLIQVPGHKKYRRPVGRFFVRCEPFSTEPVWLRNLRVRVGLIDTFKPHEFLWDSSAAYFSESVFSASTHGHTGRRVMNSMSGSRGRDTLRAGMVLARNQTIQGLTASHWETDELGLRLFTRLDRSCPGPWVDASSRDFTAPPRVRTVIEDVEEEIEIVKKDKNCENLVIGIENRLAEIEQVCPNVNISNGIMHNPPTRGDAKSIARSAYREEELNKYLRDGSPGGKEIEEIDDAYEVNFTTTPLWQDAVRLLDPPSITGVKEGAPTNLRLTKVDYGRVKEKEEGGMVIGHKFHKAGFNFVSDTKAIMDTMGIRFNKEIPGGLKVVEITHGNACKEFCRPAGLPVLKLLRNEYGQDWDLFYGPLCRREELCKLYSNMPAASKRRIDDAMNRMDCGYEIRWKDRTVQFFVKGDEKIPKRKSRMIFFSPTLGWIMWVVMMDEVMRRIKMQPHQSFTVIDNYVPCTYYFACGMTQLQMCELATDAEERLARGEKVVLLCGDDNTRGDGAEDASMYDSSQLGVFLAAQICVFEHILGCKVPPHILKLMLEVHTGNVDGAGISVDRKGFQLPSGAVWTLLFNSLGIYIYNSYRAKATQMLRSVGWENVCEPGVIAAQWLGLTMTRIPNEGLLSLEGQEFLKGLFIGFETKMYWLPLPSRVVKCSSKIVGHKEKLWMEGDMMKRHTKSVVDGYKSFLLDPVIFAPFVVAHSKWGCKSLKRKSTDRWVSVTTAEDRSWWPSGREWKRRCKERLSARYGWTDNDYVRWNGILEKVREGEVFVRAKGKQFSAFTDVDYLGKKHEE